MKKQLLLFFVVFVSGGFLSLQAQYYYNFYNDGENPKGLNTDGENPYPSTANTGWNAIWNGGTDAPTAYTPVQTIPFAFEFNGNPVTQYVAGNFGSVTFTNETPLVKPSSFSNLTLPSLDIPNNSVCVLGMRPRTATSGNTTFTSAVMTKTFGTAPNRQHWIWFNFYGEANIQNGWTYWAVVLEETTHDIYIVDMKTLCVNASNQRCNNNVKMSAGIQLNATTAYSVGGSPDLGANQIQENLFTAEDNTFYRFSFGNQPPNSVRLKEVTMEPYNLLSQAPFQVSAVIQNHGSGNLNNVSMSYRINGESWQEATINTPSLAKDQYLDITHTLPWTPDEPGSYLVEVWVNQPNGGTDPRTDDHLASQNIEVSDTFVKRRTLLEVYSSSTCGPCRPGNIVLKNVTDQMAPDEYAYIKYQYSFPGTGDPYFNPESAQRAAIYNGVSAVPTTFIDGIDRINPNSATLAMVRNRQTIPAFIDIEAQAVMAWKDNVTFELNVKPYLNFDAGLRLFVAVNEKRTTRNAKTNGETEFFNVFKRFAFGHQGMALPALTKGVDRPITGNVQFNGTYRLPLNAQTNNIINWNTEHSIESFSNLEIVVFIQDINTKQILQAQVQDVNTNTHVEQVSQALPFVVYPNPANHLIYIDLENTNPTHVLISNVQGQKIFETQVTEKAEINTATWPNGIYFVTLNQNGTIATRKIIVQH